jgi:hypothetical protein
MRGIIVSVEGMHEMGFGPTYARAIWAPWTNGEVNSARRELVLHGLFEEIKLKSKLIYILFIFWIKIINQHRSNTVISYSNWFPWI